MPKKRIKGTFTSVWENGIVTSSCELDPTNGELSPEMIDGEGNLGCLEREYFQTPDGDELAVCPTCHGFLMKTAMQPGIGHTLNEEEVCSNPECESHE